MCRILLFFWFSRSCPLSTVLLALSWCGTFCFGLVSLLLPWFSLLYSSYSSLVERPYWPSTMEASCLLAFNSAASLVPYGFRVGCCGNAWFQSKPEWNKADSRKVIPQSQQMNSQEVTMWGHPRVWGRFILVDREFEVTLSLGFLYLTTKSESQKGKLGGSLRWLSIVYHPQPPETEEVGFTSLPGCPEPLYQKAASSTAWRVLRWKVPSLHNENSRLNSPGWGSLKC